MKLLFGLPFLFVMVLTFASCTSSYVKNVTVSTLKSANLMDSHKVERNQTFVLHRASKIYLYSNSLSEAALNTAEAPPYPRRQYRLEKELLKNLQVSFPSSIKGETGLSLQDAFIHAATQHADFLIYAYVARNDERLNTVNEISEGRGVHDSKSYGPDHSTMTLVLFDVYSQLMLDTIQVQSDARWFAGEDNTQDHLQAATAAAVMHISSFQ